MYFVKHLLLLEVKAPRRLGMVPRAPVRVMNHMKVCEGPDLSSQLKFTQQLSKMY